MQWVWQSIDFPNFEYDTSLFLEFEREFHRNTGIIIGTLRHLEAENVENLKIEILT